MRVRNGFTSTATMRVYTDDESRTSAARGAHASSSLRRRFQSFIDFCTYFAVRTRRRRRRLLLLIRRVNFFPSTIDKIFHGGVTLSAIVPGSSTPQTLPPRRAAPPPSHRLPCDRVGPLARSTTTTSAAAATTNARKYLHGTGTNGKQEKARTRTYTPLVHTLT